MIIGMCTDLTAECIFPFQIRTVCGAAVSNNKEGCNSIIFFQCVQYQWCVWRRTVIEGQGNHFLISIYRSVYNTIVICNIQAVAELNSAGQ